MGRSWPFLPRSWPHGSDALFAAYSYRKIHTRWTGTTPSVGLTYYRSPWIWDCPRYREHIRSSRTGTCVCCRCRHCRQVPGCSHRQPHIRQGNHLRIYFWRRHTGGNLSGRSSYSFCARFGQPHHVLRLQRHPALYRDQGGYEWGHSRQVSCTWLGGIRD